MKQDTKTTAANDDGDINDPVHARRYVENFAPRHLGKTATYVQTNAGLIHFKTMSDEDAVWVAHQFKEWERVGNERHN